MHSKQKLVEKSMLCLDDDSQLIVTISSHSIFRLEPVHRYVFLSLLIVHPPLASRPHDIIYLMSQQRSGLWRAEAKPLRGAGGGIGKFASNPTFPRKKGQASNLVPQTETDMDNNGAAGEETQEREELFSVCS